MPEGYITSNIAPWRNATALITVHVEQALSKAWCFQPFRCLRGPIPASRLHRPWQRTWRGTLGRPPMGAFQVQDGPRLPLSWSRPMQGQPGAPREITEAELEASTPWVCSKTQAARTWKRRLQPLCEQTPFRFCHRSLPSFIVAAHTCVANKIG